MDEKFQKGFVPCRTIRLIALIVAFFGMFVLMMERVFSSLLQMANEILALAFARYNNFTGKFAAENFAEDKQLLSLLKSFKSFMPTADLALTILLFFAVFLLVIALVGLAFPKESAHVLVALKFLKWQTDEEQNDINPFKSKYMRMTLFVILILFIVFFGLNFILKSLEQNKIDKASRELETQALSYVDVQKLFFNKKGKIGYPKGLNLDSINQNDFFNYQIGKDYFIAETKIKIGKCKEKSKWRVKTQVSGLFTKELKFLRTVPTDKKCKMIAPNFKNLNRR